MNTDRQMPEFIAKIPLAIKIIIGIVVVALIFYKVFYASYRENENKKNFYTNNIFSTVLSSNSFEGRTIEFHLENGLKLYFFPPVENKLMIGDSIKKVANTYIYDVYRKDVNGEYKFWATYDFEKVY